MTDDPEFSEHQVDLSAPLRDRASREKLNFINCKLNSNYTTYHSKLKIKFFVGRNDRDHEKLFSLLNLYKSREASNQQITHTKQTKSTFLKPPTKATNTTLFCFDPKI